MDFKRTAALVVGIVMAFAAIFFFRGVILIVQDYSRPDVGKGENTIGLFVVLLLGCASAFEAYRFLGFFERDRKSGRNE